MRWGILGLGIAGKARAQAIRDDPRATLVCGFGGDLAGAGLVAAPSATTLLDQVDAVAICSPDTTHPAYVRAALAAGRHVLCEYPLTATEDDALALFAEARRLNLTLHVAHIEVMTPIAPVPWAAWMRLNSEATRPIASSQDTSRQGSVVFSRTIGFRMRSGWLA